MNSGAGGCYYSPTIRGRVRRLKYSLYFVQLPEIIRRYRFGIALSITKWADLRFADTAMSSCRSLPMPMT